MKLIEIIIKYENHNQTWKSSQNDLNFKVYVCHVQAKVYIHIPNMKSPQNNMHERTWLKDVYV